MQYFVQSFGARQPYPKPTICLMDIATEEFSHLEIVGATITMLLDGVNGELKNAVEPSGLAKSCSKPATAKDELIHEAPSFIPQFLVLPAAAQRHRRAGMPLERRVRERQRRPDRRPPLQHRRRIAREDRLRVPRCSSPTIPTLRDARLPDDARDRALADVHRRARRYRPNFPPGVLQGDPRFTHAYFNMSNGAGTWTLESRPRSMAERPAVAVCRGPDRLCDSDEGLRSIHPKRYDVGVRGEGHRCTDEQAAQPGSKAGGAQGR